MAETKQIRGAIALAAVALCAIGGLYFLASKPEVAPTPVASAPPLPTVPPPPAPVPAGTPAPEFDVVRVDAGGNAVIAGRAAPGAMVTVRSGGDVIGMATADESGAFALAPDTPLPAGGQQLSLSETLPGGQVVAGQSSATVDVPAQNAPNAKPLSVLSGPQGSKVMSGQGPQAGTLGLGTVDYDADGHAIFSGTAKPGDKVSLSLDKTKVGDAVAGADGHWRLTAQVPQSNGTLRVTDGAAAPASAPFALETLPDALADGHVVIAPGQNLWLIARHVYGHGNMYTLIYDANAGEIHDPNLIFPGQAFALPKQKS
jgi:nucleoid-associated protein YgaU